MTSLVFSVKPQRESSDSDDLYSATAGFTQEKSTTEEDKFKQQTNEQHKCCCHHAPAVPAAVHQHHTDPSTPLWDQGCFLHVPKYAPLRESEGATSRQVVSVESKGADVENSDSHVDVGNDIFLKKPGNLFHGVIY